VRGTNGKAARRAAEAARGRAEADTLVHLAGALLTEQDPLAEVMGQVRPAHGPLADVQVGVATLAVGAHEARAP